MKNSMWDFLRQVGTRENWADDLVSILDALAISDGSDREQPHNHENRTFWFSKLQIESLMLSNALQ